MRKALITPLALFVLLAASRSSNAPDLYWARLSFQSKNEIHALAQKDFDIAGIDHENKQFMVLTDAVGLGQLRGVLGYTLLASEAVTQVAKTSAYKKPEDIKQILTGVESRYPSLAKVQIIGQSLEGRDIYAIRLTDRFMVPPEGKPTVLFDANHHAREVMTPEVALDIVEYLASNYNTDPKVQAWLQRNEVWVVPMVNPDGNNQVWLRSKQWRKNTRGGYGVDNNRNYPYAWGSCKGSSSSTGSDSYRGSGPASEPETQALMNLAKTIKPTINVSFHTFSEVVLYPFGCPGLTMSKSNKTLFQSVGAEFASKLVRDSGRGTYKAGTIYDVMYPADGGSIDWMYSELKTLAFAVELNSMALGFSPSFSRYRDDTVRRARPGWQYILDRLSGSSVRVQTLPKSLVRVETESGTPVAEKESDSDGWTHFLVEPGRYHVIDLSGLTATHAVTVTSGLTVVHL